MQWLIDADSYVIFSFKCSRRHLCIYLSETSIARYNNEFFSHHVWLDLYYLTLSTAHDTACALLKIYYLLSFNSYRMTYHHRLTYSHDYINYILYILNRVRSIYWTLQINCSLNIYCTYLYTYIEDVEKFNVQTLSVYRRGKNKIRMLSSETSINVL